MERFAALVELPESQMLIVLEEDAEDQDITNLKHTAIVDGMRVSISLGFKGDAGYADADQILAEVDTVYAERMLDSIKAAVADFGR